MSPRVAVCFHIGYFDRFAQFARYVDNVIASSYVVDLYITYREDNVFPDEISARYPDATIIKANRGCDTGAFLVSVKAILQAKVHYDYIFKLHTKSNNLGQAWTSTWADDLLKHTAESTSAVHDIFHKFKHNPKIGMLGCSKWITKRDINYQIFTDTCKRVGVDPDGRFVAGTIFWIRASVIYKAFKHIDIDAEYQLCELGKPHEPSYTHTWERVFGLIVTSCGYKIKGAKLK